MIITAKVDTEAHVSSTTQLNHNNVLWNGIFLIILVILLQVITAHGVQNNNNNTESKRRIQHAITGHILVQISYYIPINICIIILLITSIILYYLRTYQFDTIYIQYFGPLLRTNEIQYKLLPGAFYFLIGTTITAILFPIHIARYAVQCLAIADPMAAYIGQSIPSRKIISYASATISGTIACCITAWIIGYIMLLEKNDTIMTNNHFVVITSGAIACSIAEAIPFANDNVSIPIITALVAHAVDTYTNTLPMFRDR